jgi:hypothetical protein
MKRTGGGLALLVLGCTELAQEPAPHAAVPADPFLVADVVPRPSQALCPADGPAGAERRPLAGNHNFRNFIGFMSNPLQNIDPRAVTAIYPIFGGAWLSNTFPVPDGDFQLYGPALTVALSERLSVGLNQGGYAVAHLSRNPIDRQRLFAEDPPAQFRDAEVGGTRSGWLNLGGFVQYTVIEDVADQFLLTGGLRWEAPCGSHEVFQLAQHPRVASDLVEELDAALGGGVPMLRQLEGLPLLVAVTKESMRIWPASAYSHQVSVRPVQFGDLRLPAGTPIIFSQVITHHDPELFPEPEVFRPERWRTFSPSPYAYFPFAAGPRMCIGAGLATMILKLTLTVIFQHFRFSLVPGATIDARVSWTMLNPASAMPMRLLPLEARFASVPVNGSVHDLVDLGAGREAARSRAV